MLPSVCRRWTASTHLGRSAVAAAAAASRHALGGRHDPQQLSSSLSASLRTSSRDSASLSSSSSGKKTRSRLPRMSWGKLLLAGAACGTALAAYESRQRQKVPVGVANRPSADDFVLASPPPHITPTRQIRCRPESPSSSSSPPPPPPASKVKWTLYQYQTCPFCCKARAVMDYFGLDYDVVEVNSVTRKQTKWSPYRKVPMVVAETEDGQFLQLIDSTLITSVIATYLQDQSQSLHQVLGSYPKVEFNDEKGAKKSEVLNRYFLMMKKDDLLTSQATKENEEAFKKVKKQLNDERKWREWVDKSLVHMISPNVYRTPSEALDTFLWFDRSAGWEQNFSTWERYLVIYVGSAVMYLIARRLKKKYNLKGDVRQSLYDDCNLWLKELKKRGTPFMGGDLPNLADLAVFGVLQAMEGCDAFQDMLDNTKIGPWFYRTKEAAAQHRGQELWLPQLPEGSSAGAGGGEGKKTRFAGLF